MHSFGATYLQFKPPAEGSGITQMRIERISGRQVYDQAPQGHRGHCSGFVATP
ncbi:hypothetical protein SAMN05660880_03611 [Luteibacter sp. 22Crub2.1]|nr:hypothetical protein SAMN05660880_03611 [Luteibacter sp. 22Crub2.1]